MKNKSKAKVTYTVFNVADFLDNEEVIAEYFSAAAHDKNSGVLQKDLLFDMAKFFDNLNEEQLALVRGRIQRTIDDPRPSIPANEVFANLKKYMEAHRNSGVLPPFKK